MHLLAAYAPPASAVIAQMTVEATTNEHKPALPLLGVLPLAVRSIRPPGSVYLALLVNRFENTCASRVKSASR